MGDLNALMLRRKFFGFLAGLQFGGKRNLYDVFGYKTELTSADLYALYERQDIAARVVDMPVEGVWTDPPIVRGSAGFTKAWDKLVKTHLLWTTLEQADKLCAFGPYSVVLIGAPGRSDTAIQQVTKGEPMYLRAYGAASVNIKTYVKDTANPRFGLPETYTIKLGESGDSSAPNKEIVFHHSRVIHIVDRPVQGQILGEPRLRQVYNLLHDILKISGGSAETYWLTANRGMQVDVDKEMELDAADAKALSDELEEFQHQLRRYVRTRGVKITTLGSDVADPRGVFEVLLALLSGATGIPQRLLVGSEAGQLASEQDRANWAEQIRHRRTSFAEPYVLHPIIRGLQGVGLLPASDNIEFEWPEAFHTSPLERAQTMAQQARAIVNMSRQADLGFAIATLQECRQIIGLPAEVPEGQKLPEPLEDPKMDPEDPELDPNKPQEDEPAQKGEDSAQKGADSRQNMRDLHEIRPVPALLVRNFAGKEGSGS